LQWAEFETEIYLSLPNGLLTDLLANNCQYLASKCPIVPSIMALDAQLVQPNPFSVWACRKIKVI